MRAMVIDGFSIISRAFFATPLLSSSSGVFTNAVNGFASMLLRLEQDHPVDYLAVAFDRPEPTFRHQAYTEYKGTRDKMPEELYSQFDLVRELLACRRIPIVEQAGYEADDILGTLSRLFAEQGIETLLVTGDRDSFQLVRPLVKVLYAHRSGVRELDLIDESRIAEQYGGLKPEQLIDVKALMGDASDNIPGVPKVGEKTAVQLVQRFGTLEEVLAHPGEAKMKQVQANLVTYAEQARLSYLLAKIDLQAPLETELDDIRCQSPDTRALATFYRQYNMRQLLAKLPQEETVVTDSASGDTPLSLFDSVAIPEEAATLYQSREVELPELLQRLQGDKLQALTWSASDAPWRATQATLAFAVSKNNNETDNYNDCELLWARLEKEGLVQVGALLAEKPFHTWRVKELAHLLRTPLPQAEDLALIAYLCDPGREPQLAYLIENLLPAAAAETSAPEVRELIWLQKLIEPLNTRLNELGVAELYRSMELPLSEVLRVMEQAGIRVDTAILRQLGTEFSTEMEQLKQKVYDSVGETFNLNSPKQLGTILFDKDKLGLTGGRKTKTGYSTDAETLEGLRDKHESIDLLLRYRMLAKLQGTYVEGMIPLVESDGRLRTTFHQTVTATGRLSSSDPNLQNIPIRQPEGRLLRKAFLPTEEGWQLISADYSQIELRILAHLSQDERFIDAYHQRQDIHRRTAAEVFGLSLEAVTSAQRNQAKAVNFGVVYGISDYGLATQLGISRSQAKEFIERFFERYPGIREYQRRLVEEAREQGYVTTIFQRRRYLPEIHSKNYALRSYAERTALNTPIQGSAADLIKIAMLRLSARLKEADLQSRMLLQVHDDLLCEAPATETEQVVRLMRETMESAVTLSVPLEVDIGVAGNWYEVKE